ncbi:hypothetical protein VNI00_006463 [Paramarasmius palmivorus]|uniref:F-box domain-containing protein n=1 Tax=Paramarasmius palmivorus TaxID=297713 RepID=A0AAW0D8Z5_9AGAR
MPPLFSQPNKHNLETIPAEIFGNILREIFLGGFFLDSYIDKEQQTQLFALLKVSKTVSAMVLNNSPFHIITLPIGMGLSCGHKRRTLSFLTFLVRQAPFPLRLRLRVSASTYLDVRTDIQSVVAQFRCKCLPILMERCWHSLSLTTLGPLDHHIFFLSLVPNPQMTTLEQITVDSRHHTDDAVNTLFPFIPPNVHQLSLTLWTWQPSPSQRTPTAQHVLRDVTHLVLTTSPRGTLPILLSLPHLHTAEIWLNSYQSYVEEQRFSSPVILPRLQRLTLSLVRVLSDSTRIEQFILQEALHLRDLLFHLHCSVLRSMILHWNVDASPTSQGPIRDGLEAFLTRVSGTLHQLLFVDHVHPSCFDEEQLIQMIGMCNISPDIFQCRYRSKRTIYQ